jgi:hypothetical protein
MTIQPLPPSHPHEISVTEAVEPAYERVKLMLFKPFNFTKWIVIGFCAWLAGLGESGGGGSGFNGGNFSGGNDNHGAEDLRHFFHQASDYVTANLDWIVPLAIFVFVLALGIWLVLLWLNSRGKFMFLHCVALDVAEVDVPWHRYAGPANSLFRFRVVLGLVGMVLFLPLVVVMAVDIIRMVLQSEINLPAIMICAALTLVLIVLSIVFGLIHKFTVDFVVPLLYLRGGTCMAAWREFWRLLAAHPGKFTIYILFQIVLGMAIGALIVAVCVGTCCIGCCLAALPFIGTVFLLPVFVFKRAYPLYYLAQYGSQYDVFPRPTPPPVPTTPPAPPAAPPGPISPTPESGPAPTAS